MGLLKDGEQELTIDHNDWRCGIRLCLNTFRLLLFATARPSGKKPPICVHRRRRLVPSCGKKLPSRIAIIGIWKFACKDGSQWGQVTPPQTLCDYLRQRINSKNGRTPILIPLYFIEFIPINTSVTNSSSMQQSYECYGGVSERNN